MKTRLITLAFGLLALSSALADGMRVAPDWQVPTVDGQR